MILGDVCTRGCLFCSVTQGTPRAVDHGEPRRIAEAVKELALRHVVITSVTRDDLPDDGAGHFAEVITMVKTHCPGVTVEVLTPDFRFHKRAIKRVCEAVPRIYNHNIEMTPQLFPIIRPRGNFKQSVALLTYVKQHYSQMLVKSGFMVGLGESDNDVYPLIDTLCDCGIDIITIGQYLQPTQSSVPVDRFVEPELFDAYAEYARGKGIAYVFAGPWVRSSYMAEAVFSSLA